jgi:hypothetical protein
MQRHEISNSVIETSGDEVTVFGPDNDLVSGHDLAGAAEGIRTPDPRITNALLYQLSYRGANQRPIGRLGAFRKQAAGRSRKRASPKQRTEPPPSVSGPPIKPSFVRRFGIGSRIVRRVTKRDDRLDGSRSCRRRCGAGR